MTFCTVCFDRFPLAEDGDFSHLAAEYDLLGDELPPHHRNIKPPNQPQKPRSQKAARHYDDEMRAYTATYAYKVYIKYRLAYKAFMRERKKLQKRRHDHSNPGRSADRHLELQSVRRHRGKQKGASLRGTDPTTDELCNVALRPSELCLEGADIDALIEWVYSDL